MVSFRLLSGQPSGQPTCIPTSLLVNPVANLLANLLDNPVVNPVVCPHTRVVSQVGQPSGQPTTEPILQPIYLGDSEFFSVLAGSNITESANKRPILNGEMGVSPGVVTVGKFSINIHLNDALAISAQADLAAALVEVS